MASTVTLDHLLVLLASLLTLLLPAPTLGRKHDTLVLSEGLSGTAHIRAVDGITVMSEENYDDRELVQTAVIMPRDKSASLLVQFVYVDIPKGRPCPDSLHICELASMQGIVHMCRFGMLEKFCGSLEDLFPTQYGQSGHYISTTHWGQGIRIQWVTKRPQGNHRGFKLIITAFTSNVFCDSATHWRCGDGKCISRDLHCDNVPHCVDKTDETINCSNSHFMGAESSVRMSCTSDKDMKVCLPGWNEHWLWLIVPMAIVTILLIVAITLKVRQQVMNGSLSSILRLYRHQSSQTPDGAESQIHYGDHPQPSAPLETDINESYPMMGVVLPPPYSPLEGEGVKVNCTEPPKHACPGLRDKSHTHTCEPPPLYEDSLHILRCDLQPVPTDLQHVRSDPQTVSNDLQLQGHGQTVQKERNVDSQTDDIENDLEHLESDPDLQRVSSDLERDLQSVPSDLGERRTDTAEC